MSETDLQFLFLHGFEEIREASDTQESEFLGFARQRHVIFSNQRFPYFLTSHLSDLGEN